MKISLCTITRNEERNLPRCLASVAGVVDERVIVDSGSTDATERIAAEHGARFQRRQKWHGYGDQKNFALALAAHDWVLSLDADEALSAPLRDEILRIKEGDPQVAGFSMPRCVFFEGKWIRHGDWYPDRLVRLFRRSCARFSAAMVHERLEVTGELARLQGEIEHHSFRDAADHRARGEHYAQLWAAARRAEGRNAKPWEPWSRAAFKWVRGYLLRGGFLDGATGWGIAHRNAREVYLKYRWLRRGE